MVLQIVYITMSYHMIYVNKSTNIYNDNNILILNQNKHLFGLMK